MVLVKTKKILKNEQKGEWIFHFVRWVEAQPQMNVKVRTYWL